MLFYIPVVVALCSCYLFYQSDGIAIMREYTLTKYRKWKSLKNAVSAREKNRFRALWISTRMVLTILYIGFLQYMNSSVAKRNKYYEISYVIEGKLYKMLVRPLRGPAPVLQVINDQDDDVTDEVLPYMGPRYDWHNVKISPKFFGYNSLTFELKDGSEHTYEENSHVECTPRLVNGKKSE